MATAPPPGLEPAAVTDIITFLEANGGALPLGKLTRQFKGLKKAQVAEYFVLTVGENPNDPVVSVAELTGTQLADAVARSKENASVVSAAARPAAAPAEAAPMEPAKVAEIAAILQAHGGSLNLGKLSRQCKGVKKAQLEQHFYIEVEEGAPDFFVSICPRDAMIMATPGAAVPMQAPGAALGLLPAVQANGLAGGFGPAAAPVMATAVQPLDQMTVQQIATVLSGNGGSMSLGKLSRTFRGLKKAQVEQHFAVANDANNSPVVHLQGAALCQPAAPLAGAGMGVSGLGAAGLGAGGHWRQPAVMRPPVVVRPPAMVARPPAVAAAAVRTPTPAEASAAEPLSAERVEEVRAFLEASGGIISLGKLTRQFRGLKKVQLEPHFEIGQNEGEPDRCVRLPGMDLTMLAPAVTASRKQPRSESLGITAQQPEEVQPLDPTKVQEVITFLEASNGSLPLGRVTREFRGIKKAQLAQHFVMTITDNPQDPIVSVGEPSAVALSDLSTASERKRARRDGAKEQQEGTGEVPPLDGMRLAEITDALAANGSRLPMGKLTRQFPGVKKSQLEQHLVVSWEAEARDFIVGLSDTSLLT